MSLDWAREGGDTEQCQLLQVELTECMMEQRNQNIFKDQGSMLVCIHLGLEIMTYSWEALQKYLTFSELEGTLKPAS